jgi:hypothetical protein
MKIKKEITRFLMKLIFIKFSNTQINLVQSGSNFITSIYCVSIILSLSLSPIIVLSFISSLREREMITRNLITNGQQCTMRDCESDVGAVGNGGR